MASGGGRGIRRQKLEEVKVGGGRERGRKNRWRRKKRERDYRVGREEEEEIIGKE